MTQVGAGRKMTQVASGRKMTHVVGVFFDDLAFFCGCGPSWVPGVGQEAHTDAK